MQNGFASKKETQQTVKCLESSPESEESLEVPSKAVKLSDFIFEEVLGQGGFGQVWSATTTRLANNKRFAVK